MGLLWKSPSVVSEPTVSPERAVLATAIAAHNAHLAALAATNRALQPDAIWRAKRAVQLATDALEEAHAAAGRYQVAKAQGTAGEAPQSIREARHALTDAEDNLRAVTAGQEALQAELAKLIQSQPWTENRLKDAAFAVLRVDAADAATRCAADVIRLQHEMMHAGQALQFLVRNKVFPVSELHGSRHGMPADDAITSAYYRLETRPPDWDSIVAQHDGAAEWRDALAALQTDADAILPGDL